MIELIFVIIIIALLARISIPKVNSILRGNLRSGATRVSGYLQAAYQQSIMRHTRLRVKFDPETGRYWTEIYKDPVTVPLIQVDTKLDDVLSTFKKRSDGTFEDSSDEKTQAQFEKLEEGSLKGAKLPNGISFTGIYIAQDGQKNQSENGENLWIDFYPSGFTTPSIVYIKNEYDDVMSILLPSLGGRSTIEKGEAQIQ